MFSLLDRALLMAQGHCIFQGPPAAAEGWFAARSLPCPVGTAVAEHMLDSVSDPATLQQLLAPPGGKDATLSSGGGGGAAANGVLVASPLGLPEGKAGAHNSASSVYEKSLSSSSHHVRDESLGGAAGGAKPGASAQPNLSRELAVVFWRTLIDILRNPALLLLHWCAAAALGAGAAGEAQPAQRAVPRRALGAGPDLTHRTLPCAAP